MKALAVSASTVLGGRGLVRIAQFLTFILLARLLSPADFGWYGLVTTALALATTLGSLGLRQSTAYWIGQGRITAGQAIGTNLIVAPVLIAVAGGVVALIFARQLPESLVATGVAAIFVGAAGMMVLNLMQGVHLGRGSIRAFAATDSVPRMILLVVVAGLSATVGLSLAGAVWAASLSFTLMVPFAVWLASRGGGAWGQRIGQLPRMIGYGIAFALNLFLITLSARVSMFIIESVDGPTAAGQFFAAIRVHEIFLEIATALALVVFSDAARTRGAVELIARNARLACWVFWSFAIAAVPLALLAPIIIRITIGSAYSDAAPALQILAWSLAPAAASKILYSTVAGRGKPLFGTPVILASVLLNIVLALALVPALGVTGGAAALVAGQYLLYLGYVLVCRLKYSVRVRDLIIPRKGDIVSVWRVLTARIRRRRRVDREEVKELVK